MTLTYSLDEDDFINFHLFTGSINNQLKKRRRKSSIIWGFSLFFLGWVFYQEKDKFLSYYFLIFGVAYLLFYPLYAKWRYKKYYDNYTDKIHKHSIDKITTVTIDTQKIQTVSDTTEMKILNSEIECVYEIEKYIYIKIKSGITFIIPKTKIIDLKNAREELKDICDRQKVKFIQMLDWKW